MIFEYAELACTELINSSRATVYSQLYCLPIECDACPELPCALDEEYTDPVTDDAPWYDPAVPASADVLGFMGLDVSGFQTSTFTRDPIPLIGDGSVLGVGRRSHRTIIYTVLMVVRDECALSYGLEWLAATLAGGCCDSGCHGDALSTYACCPTCDGCEELRYLYDVALMEGPSVESLEYLPEGGILARITYTLVAATPFIYREPLEASQTWVDLINGTPVVTDPDAVYDECADAEPCPDDPLCQTPALPPEVPVPVDPCYPTGPDTFLRTVISLPTTSIPAALDLVPVLELETGTLDIRRLVVRFRASLTGTDCNDPVDPCSVCTDIQIPFLPAGSVLTIDGRVKRAELECIQEPLGSVTTRPIVYGAQGAAFVWPVFKCPTALCIEILTTQATTTATARARVLLVPRSDVG
ncbi:hypothetical protein [Embleya sp. NPDC001921]